MSSPRHAPAGPGPYRVLVRDLPTRKEIAVGGPFVAAVIAGLPMREALGRPAEDADAGGGVLDVELDADGTHVFARGTMRGHLVVACGRCVGPARIDIDEPVMVTFVPPHEVPADPDAPPAEAPHGAAGKGRKARPKASAPEPADDASDDLSGTEIAADDLDVFPYDGEIVDLEPLIREHFVLAVPYAPLCRDDCKGLCPQCGVDRNVEACACEPPPDPRFAALKGLKLPS
jgi:uncharacterized protein